MIGPGLSLSSVAGSEYWAPSALWCSGCRLAFAVACAEHRCVDKSDIVLLQRRESGCFGGRLLISCERP